MSDTDKNVIVDAKVVDDGEHKNLESSKLLESENNPTDDPTQYITFNRETDARSSSQLWLQQFKGMMYRNYLLKVRNKCSTIFEILLPVIVMLGVVGIRAAVEKTDNPNDLHLDKASDFLPTTSYPGQYASLVPGQGLPPGQRVLGLQAKAKQVGYTFAFAPNNAITQAMQADFEADFPYFASQNWPTNVKSMIFDSDEAITKYCEDSSYAKYPDKPGILGAIILTETDSKTAGSRGWSYRLRFNATGQNRNIPAPAVPNTFRVLYKDDLQLGYVGQYYFMFMTEGALAAQVWAERWMVKYSTNGFHPESAFRVQPFPTVAHKTDEFADFVGAMLGLLFTLTFMWPVTRLVSLIVEEKEKRIREGMKMMGLEDSVLWLSWFATYVVIFFIISLLIVIFTGSSVYELSDKGLIFLYFFMFGIAVFCFCFLVSVFFDRARVASTMGGLVFLGSFFPYFALSSSSTAGARTMACLSAPICFGQAATLIAELESNQQGLTNSSVGTTVDNFRFSTFVVMMIVDSLLYLFLGFYFDKTWKGQYGIKLPHCFCCRPSWCCGTSTQSYASTNDGSARDMKGPEGRTFEKVPDGMDKRVGIRIRGLRKEFPPPESAPRTTPNFVAVKSLDLDMYRGQIFALLGHNGAGKSTTINMLTGLYAPTQGDALVNAQSILTALPDIRRDLGVCPQHDILFDHLTVEEHLHLFCAIKCIPSDLIQPAVDQMIETVGLTEKRNSKSMELSGGQKRKLSVGIALIGGSKVVVLDEPTSGMDPYSRRSTWELLRQGKSGRVIILTTHFMDEADQLGDRIAIMADGEVRCCGSPLFLKSIYGVGYTMTVSAREDTNKEKMNKCTELVLSSVPEAEVLSRAAGEVSFRLPFDGSAHFPALFSKLDEDQAQKGASMGVDSYGISVTTLEEVFLRVARNEADISQREEDKKSTHKAQMLRAASESRLSGSQDAGEEKKERDMLDAKQDSKGVVVNVKEAPQTPAEIKSPLARFSEVTKELDVEYSSTLTSHFKALLIKRWHNAKRDRKVWTWTLIYPFLIMLAGVGLLKLGQTLKFTARNLQTTNFNSPLRVPYNQVVPPPNLFPTNSSGLNSLTQAGNMQGVAVSNISSDLEMSQYLLNTYFTSGEESRYGAFNFRSVTPALANFTIFINTTSAYALPVFYNVYSNMLLQQFTQGDASAKIECTIDPLPITKDQQALQSSLTAVLISIGMAFIPASFVAYVVREREVKAKHQQLISGVNTLSYWMANYMWDFVNFMIPGLLAFAIVAMYDIENLLGEAAPVTLVAIILYGLSVIPFSYLCSFLFTEHTSAQNTMLMTYIMTGAILLIVSIILSIIESTQDINDKLVFIYRILPNYCFGEAFAGIIVRDASVVFGSPQTPWAMDVSGWPLLYMAIEAVVYFALVQVVEYIYVTPEILTKCVKQEQVEEKPYEIDPDIAAEARRVESGGANNDMIRLHNLKKVYPGRLGGKPKLAVRDLSFGIPEGQCFGFLGINGAGKTTTLSILTADTLPTSGEAFLNNQNIMTEQQQIRRLIGYCPQFDALIDTLTAREHLYFYARIKGMPEELLDRFSQRMIEQLGLTQYADKPAGGYSGGNKRKLSVGIALIGNPKIVFLDEPSTGMDPNSRRFMWELISSTMAGRSVILTTHSMEESEALCSRIGIMVGGRLRCLGSANHLKHRYGDGYQIDINTGSHPIGEVRKFIKEQLPGAQVLEKHPSSIKYRVNRNKPLADLFGMVEQHREQLHITEYSISETTLEQIFIHFAKQQEEETGAVSAFDTISPKAADAPAHAPANEKTSSAQDVIVGVEMQPPPEKGNIVV